MKKTFSLVLLTTCLITSCFALPESNTVPTLDQQFETAKRETAIVFLKNLSPATMRSDAEVLADLGEIEAARRLWQKLPNGAEKSVLGPNITVLAAKKAIRDDRLDVAEREIRSLRGNQVNRESLWLALSKKYSQKKQLIEARRTAFYALKQLRDQKLTYAWPEVAMQLCASGDQATARRLFAIAKQDSWDSWAGPNASEGIYVMAAARCGFDDLAFETEGYFSIPSVGIWARQNRDDIARRFMERALKASENEGAGRGLKGPSGSVASAVKRECLRELANGQIGRGDMVAATATIRALDALIDVDRTGSDWFGTKVANLGFYESTGQWHLANEAISAIKSFLEEHKPYKVPEGVEFDLPPDERPQELQIARLASLKLILRPNKFTFEQRRAAYERIKPLLLQFAAGGPAQKSRAYIALARAQRSLGNPAWRSNLEVARTVLLPTKPSRDKIWGLSMVSQAWGEAGESKRIRQIGKQMVAVWRQEQHQSGPDRLEKTSTMDLTSLLLSGGCVEEVTDLLFPETKVFSHDYFNAVLSLASHSKTGPPAKLLALPLKERREALNLWAHGLARYDSTESDFMDDRPVKQWGF